MAPFSSHAASTPPAGQAAERGECRRRRKATSTLPSIQASSLRAVDPQDIGPVCRSARARHPCPCPPAVPVGRARPGRHALVAPPRGQDLRGRHRQPAAIHRAGVELPGAGCRVSRGVEKVTPSREVARYISREPPSELRHITRSLPAESIATEGWQHSQMEPAGRLIDRHVLRPGDAAIGRAGGVKLGALGAALVEPGGEERALAVGGERVQAFGGGGGNVVDRFRLRTRFFRRRVERHTNRSPSEGRPWACAPSSGLLPATAVMTMVFPESAMRGPRWRLNGRMPASATLAGAENVLPPSLR